MEQFTKMEIDKNTRRLIIFDIYLLISLVSMAIIFTFLKDYISVQISLISGLIVGIFGIYYLMRLIKKIVKSKGD